MPTDEILTLEIEPPYIGSAVSPTVDIDETTDDITVTITDFRGEHSYTVEKTDQAIEDAEHAAQNADTATNAANDAVTRANNTITGITQTANQVFAQAGQATIDANVAAQSANTAATSANNAANAANAAAGQATTAATSANNAATLANTKAELADTAAQNADTATTAANNAAQTATTAAEQADAAREAIQDDLAAKADKDGYYPQLTAGLADTLMSGDSELVQFAQRTSDHDGMVSIQSIRGNTIVENDELVSVNVEGVKAIGFNQWDEEWEVGGLNTTTGETNSNTDRIRSKNFIPVIPGSRYYFTNGSNNLVLLLYGGSKDYLGIYAYKNPTQPFGEIPGNCHYVKFYMVSAYGTIYKSDICINISDSVRNGIYEPYRETTRTIPASTYFPDGLRSAGTAYDELDFVNHKAVTRIGAVDLGTLDWATLSTPEMHIFRTTINNKGIKGAPSNSVNGNGTTLSYEIMPWSPLSSSSDGKFAISTDSSNRLVFVDADYSTVEAFVTAITGEMLFYELATPTETEIDPPFNMTYPVEQGGTESIVVPTGEMSAPPTLVTVYAYDADGIVNKSQSIVAPVEGARASANYSVGSYLVQSGTLYRVTTAIATGETITPGSNVTATTVMAELIRLTA